MRNKKKIIIFFFPSLFIFGLILYILLLRTEKPPMVEIETARQAITEARYNMANLYAASLFGKSENFFDSAMSHLHLENEKIFFNRDYSSAKNFARQSANYARDAKNKALNESNEVQLKLKTRLNSLNEELAEYQDFFELLPLPEQVLTDNSRGKLYLSEAEIAFNKGQYSLSEEKLESAEKNIRRSFQSADALLKDYFEQYPEWQKWAQNTVNYSDQNNSYVIIVDKIAREIKVYYNGKPEQTFRIELGKNWIGDKQYKGDKATPEGYYTVIDKKQDPHTKFYKALLLDYPNTDDVRRFNSGKKEGKLPGSAEIGGLIEIHGDGGKGNDWTDGCIALKNSDMDLIYNIIGIGTRITIVGSLRPFEDVSHDKDEI